MKQFTRNTIYTLKRAYGSKVWYYRVIGKTLDLTTGQQVITTQVTTIRRAIFLPTNVARTTLSKNEYYFDPNKRLVIIDRHDIDFEIKIGDYIIYNGSKYSIIEDNDYELGGAFSLIVQSDDRAKWLLANDTLILTQTAGYTIV